jgi:hypothetical protein
VFVHITIRFKSAMPIAQAYRRSSVLSIVSVYGEVDGDRHGHLPWQRLEGKTRTNSLQRACIKRRLTAASHDLQTLRTDLAVLKNSKGNGRGAMKTGIPSLVGIDEIGLDLF